MRNRRASQFFWPKLLHINHIKQRYQDIIIFNIKMVPSTDNALPSFLFQMLRDHEVNPHQVYLVPDNAVAPNLSLRQAMSAPCLNRTLKDSMGKGSFSGISRPESFMSNARWSPNCVPSPKSKGVTMKSSTARALLMDALWETNEPSSHEKTKKKKKSTKKSSSSSSSSSKSSSLSPMGSSSSRKARSTHPDAALSQSTSSLFKNSHHMIPKKSASSDSLLEFIKPRRRASPSPTERRNFRINEASRISVTATSNAALDITTHQARLVAPEPFASQISLDRTDSELAK